LNDEGIERADRDVAADGEMVGQRIAVLKVGEKREPLALFSRRKLEPEISLGTPVENVSNTSPGLQRLDFDLLQLPDFHRKILGIEDGGTGVFRVRYFFILKISHRVFRQVKAQLAWASRLGSAIHDDQLNRYGNLIAAFEERDRVADIGRVSQLPDQVGHVVRREDGQSLGSLTSTRLQARAGGLGSPVFVSSITGANSPSLGKE
jgi:hypothetical protein